MADTDMFKKQFIVFNIEKIMFGIDIEYVESIENMLSITRVPNFKDFLLGVINLRGQIVPVIDISKKYNIKNSGNVTINKIIICKYEDYMIGITADGVDITSLTQREQIKKNEEKSTDYISAIFEYKDNVVSVLNIKKILDIK